MDDSIPLDAASIQLRDKAMACAGILREFADSVVIVCTLNEGENTDLIYTDKGHHWAGIASVRRYLDIKAIEQKKKDGL